MKLLTGGLLDATGSDLRLEFAQFRLLFEGHIRVETFKVLEILRQIFE